MNYKPLNDNVIVEKNESASTSAGGIVLTTSIESDQATVIAVSEKVSDVQVGDVVIINWGRAQKIGKNEYRLSIDEILAVVE